MTEPRLKVLFLCTGNSARSQMAEAILRSLSHGRADVHSAGTHPRPDVHPMAKAALASEFKLDEDALGLLIPKAIDRFLGQPFDYVITLCDPAAESCPVFPGDPKRIHWDFSDPAAAEGSDEDKQDAFNRTAIDLAGRLRVWMALPQVSERIG